MIHRKHFWGWRLFFTPRTEWRMISKENLDVTKFGIFRMLILAAVPAISFLIGINQIGGSRGGIEFNQVALADALPMALAFYVLIIVFTLLMTYFTFAIERTFGEEASFGRCLVFITYTATPMYMAGLIGLIPILWLSVQVLLLAVGYSLYLLYLGVPIFMNIDEGKGYVVSTSIIWAGLCMVVIFNGLAIATVMLVT